jgi:energy-coupling factor transport system ATP-binding protein
MTGDLGVDYNPHAAVLEALSAGRCVLVDGLNFSGRSEVLQYVTRLPIRAALDGHDSYGHLLPRQPIRGQKDRYAYVGPEVYQALSGLASTVRAELMLNAFGGAADADSLCSQVGLAELSGNGCFELSGGQQAILAAAASVALRPCILSLDCCLEQVDKSRRDLLLESILAFDEETNLVVADNELDNLTIPDGGRRITQHAYQTPKRRFQMAPAKCMHSLQPRVPAPRLQLKGVSFGYRRGCPVLRALDLDLEPGQVYWLNGANGSGKSTLAKLLAGVLVPQGGQMLADGKDWCPAESPGALVSYHFQNPDFQMFSTTVLDEVVAGPMALGDSPVEARRRSLHVLDQLAIPATLHDKHPLDLPFTLRKRVAVAAAISSGTPWLVLDEPSLGQDCHNTSAMAALIKTLATAGAGLIVISHSSRLAAETPGVTLQLEQGRIVAA